MTTCTPKLLKSVRHLNPGGDSATWLFTVRCAAEPTRSDLMALNIRGYRCSCEHDCCGHVQYSAPYVLRHNKRNEWLVDQSAVRNV